MEELVVDSNIVVASFLEQEEFHQKGRLFIDGLDRGDYVFHLPMLVIVEVAAAISRRVQKNRQALLIAWRQNNAEWERDGALVLYDLSQERMHSSVNVAERLRLTSADAVIASLAEELNLPLRSFDKEVLEKVPRASA